MTKRSSDVPWSVPVAVADVPPSGRHFNLVADGHVRAAIAKLAGIDAVPRLAASFDVTLHGSHGLHVLGQVCATVEQTCVVTLEPIENEIAESVDIVFAPNVPSAGLGSGEVIVAMDDEPEPLLGGVVDLGALATEFLLLGIDPNPRKAGAAFESPAGEARSTGAFAALAALKKARGNG